jgi:hypothetical protein
MDRGALALVTLCSLVAGLAVLLDLYRARAQAARDAARLVYELRLPLKFEHQAVLGLVLALGGMLRPAGPELRGVPTIVLEAEGAPAGRRYRVAMPPYLEREVQHQLESHIPGAQLLALPTPETRRWTAGMELRKTNNSLAMTLASPEIATRTLLAGLDVRLRGGAVMVQLVFAPAMWRRPLLGENGKPHGQRFAVAARIAARGQTRAAAQHLLFQMWHAVNGLRTHAVGLAPRHWPLQPWVLDRIHRRAARRWLFPAHLSATELSVLSGWPAEVDDTQGLPAPRARQLLPDPAIATHGVPFARSNVPGRPARPLAVSPTNRMQHAMIVGPTGSGKSTAMGGIILGDIDTDAGVGVMAPPDLIEDVLRRIPPRRAGDVILFEPARGTQTFGLDVFAGSEPFTAADHILSIFRELYSDSWGPRMAAHLRNALQTLAVQPGATLCDIQRILTDDQYRTACAARLDNPQLLAEWRAYDALKPGRRSAEIASVLNKVHPLLGNDRLRRVFGPNPATLDLGAIVNGRKIFLVALPKGELGDEATRLIGSTVVALFWRAVLGRSALPPDQRTDFYFHIDEAPSFMNLPVSLGEMLTQARAYRCSLDLAFQDIGKFKAGQRSEMLANARNKMVFRAAHHDATLLGKELGLADPTELQRLRRFEVMVQLVTDEGLSSATTGDTILPGQQTGMAGDIRRRIAAEYRQLVPTARDTRLARDNGSNGLPAHQPVGIEP